ncbi:MAG: hypothetical protein M1838_005194 [Thelocarpon superellum]|nr:MAG: hypothetical protein M1838_005194 [Thelocarpon superellum]
MQPEVEEIQSGGQLQKLLKFRQDTSFLKSAYGQFKLFLDPLEQKTLLGRESLERQRILKEYLDLEDERSGEDDGRYLASIMQAWAQASQNNNDTLFSTIAEVLTSFLRIISTKIDFRDHGIRACRALLQPAQLKLLARGTSTSRSKERVLGSTLALLTEVVSFDGGSLARRVYDVREFTCQGLGRNLALRGDASGASKDKRQKSSVRHNALRYLFAHFRFQTSANKSDLLGHRDVIAGIFRDLGEDTPELIHDVLTGILEHIIRDEKLPSFSKRRVLTDWSLGRVSSLYRYKSLTVKERPLEKAVDVEAHEFLLLVCTTPGLGVLYPRSGWYPPGTDGDLGDDQEDSDDADAIDLGPDVGPRSQGFGGELPLRNSTLSKFIQTLRPQTSTMQSELILAIFRAAPELTADYFAKKQHVALDPKLTTAWIGYLAFILSTVQLPMPTFCGPRDGYAASPPPISVASENILPTVLSRKVLTRCLTQKVPLVTFLALRLLIVAFEKLQQVLDAFRSASSQGLRRWEEGEIRLIEEFCRRCPKMSHVITVFRTVSEEKSMQREAATRLLEKYYAVIPQVALDEKFDVSSPLTASLRRVADLGTPLVNQEMRPLELERLLHIARYSPDMRWFNKSEGVPLSPFTTLVSLAVGSSRSLPMTSVRQVLAFVSHDRQLFQEQTAVPALNALTASLPSDSLSPCSLATFVFLDACVGRYVRKAVYYQGGLERLVMEGHDGPGGEGEAAASPILVTLCEQWPFIVKEPSVDADSKDTIAQWLARLLQFLHQIGEDRATLLRIRDMMNDESGSDNQRMEFTRVFARNQHAGFILVDDPVIVATGSTEAAATTEMQDRDDASEDEELMNVEVSSEDPAALFRWVKKDVQAVLEDGDAAGLIRCLCSEEIGIRRQGLSGLARMVVRMQESGYAEKEMVVLLLQELLHTAKGLADDGVLPTYLVEFAARAILVQTDPSHFLYGKVNQFLHRGPTWDADRVPLLRQILLQPPEADDAFFDEVVWLLDMVILGLRTPQDLDAYRRGNVFERFLSLYNAPHLPTTLRRQILQLLLRASSIEGGSTTLITRVGVLSWLRGHRGRDETATERQLQHLARRIWDTCDQGRVQTWSGGSIMGVVV